VVPELLDTDSGTPEEIAASLADLQWFNRYFGGHSTAAALIRAVQGSLLGVSEFSYLDIASASADNLLHAQRSLPDLKLSLTLLDRSPKHLPSEPGQQGIVRICGDALALPFRDATFDVVGSSLFVHHLEPNEVLLFAKEALRVCRHAVLINDLVRSPIHYAMAVAGKPLYHSRLTRHDAPASVRRAYTPAELREVLNQSGARRIAISRHYFYRMGLVLWR
jgi:ubiquinone/menaquinone biosynthesis C-methylase UbiE